MISVERGTTRLVVLTSRSAWKFPALHSWRGFLNGLLGNMTEAEFAALGWPELCPIRWAAPAGLLVVMARAKSLTDAEWQALDVAAFADRCDGVVPVEDKQSSFGVLDGRIVAVDYGSPSAH